MMKPLAIGALMTLAACGGGGEDSVAEYADDAARADRIIDQTERLTRTLAAAMPTRGRAEYDGVVGLAFGGAPDSLQSAQMIGDLELDADFGAGTIRGEMDDFNTRDGRELDGELRIGNGRITGSGFTGTASGTLTGGAGAPGAVGAAIGGEFLGHGAEAVAGAGTGTSAGGDVGLLFRGVRDRD
ncbi:MAG: transferrin-binding protein-like solute binding protein [Paracoccus sp. (in: a-proteobacteria)]|uniref:transferrin-binding protein-like solute binding protein n=1 Tax=Paracoccus sp. TaxID=267 RepID=UPI004057CE10